MRLKHDEGWSIPADRPFYPSLPAYYRNVRSQLVFFQVEPDSVAEFLPEPLEPAEDGMCLACGMTVPFCSNYGPFDEAFIELKCKFRGEPGWYVSHVFHNGPAGIAAGREIYGTPKLYAHLNVMQEQGIMTTEVQLAGQSIISITSSMERASVLGDLPSLSPSWRLKLIPRADSPRPAIKQLVDGSQALQDLTVHLMLQGSGVTQFLPTPIGGLSHLKPQRYLQAFYMETSYTETFGKIIYDYLNNSSASVSIVSS
ncbi:MAG TPA: acetoacetate decarboxylase family protein [Terriglobia bacterium]|nr:acetoacetate decarboxylase family protein [Terriglobia bacterium]